MNLWHAQQKLFSLLAGRRRASPQFLLRIITRQTMTKFTEFFVFVFAHHLNVIMFAGLLSISTRDNCFFQKFFFHEKLTNPKRFKSYVWLLLQIVTVSKAIMFCSFFVYAVQKKLCGDTSISIEVTFKYEVFSLSFIRFHTILFAQYSHLAFVFICTLIFGVSIQKIQYVCTNIQWDVCVQFIFFCTVLQAFNN